MLRFMGSQRVGPGFDPGLGRSVGEGNSYPLQYSGLENSMDRGSWQATVTLPTSRFQEMDLALFMKQKKSNPLQGKGWRSCFPFHPFLLRTAPLCAAESCQPPWQPAVGAALGL